MDGEGLLRWHNNDGSIVLPGLFMPKLENTTLIDPVPRYVIRKACEDVLHHSFLPVSINFSGKKLMDVDLVKNLGRIVALYGVEPAKLEIEITEQALIQDPAHTKVAIESLRKQGFPVSLDDFGTGYSSFPYLAHLPLSGLKIDRAFVSSLEESAHVRTVLSAMIKMSHSLKWFITLCRETQHRSSGRSTLIEILPDGTHKFARRAFDGHQQSFPPTTPHTHTLSIGQVPASKLLSVHRAMTAPGYALSARLQGA